VNGRSRGITLSSKLDGNTRLENDSLSFISNFITILTRIHCQDYYHQASALTVLNHRLRRRTITHFSFSGGITEVIHAPYYFRKLPFHPCSSSRPCRAESYIETSRLNVHCSLSLQCSIDTCVRNMTHPCYAASASVSACHLRMVFLGTPVNRSISD
jgi:hypothetical protein